MDVDEEDSFVKKCYKCDGPVLDNLNIVYNSSNSKLLLWNKYQIFIYEASAHECPEKTIIPEFQIDFVIATNNYLLCLDCNGNVHILSLKFKSLTQKSLKFPFQSRDLGIITTVRYKEDLALSLKYEADAYFLCLNRINSDFQLIKQVILLCENEHWPMGQNERGKYLLVTHSINKDNLHHLNKIFKVEESNKNIDDLVLVSFNRHSVHGCIFSPKITEEELTLVQLYEAPAEICNIEIVEKEGLYLIVELKMGTIVRLSLDDTTKTPEIEHLNTALYKILSLEDCLIYTDGTSMWKAENMFTNNLKFTQIFLKNVKDFAKCGDQIMCTTFSNLIYKFSIEDKNCYVTKKSEEYCSAEKLFNNSAYLNKLFEEIDKNKEMVKKLQKEEDYITVLALSKRQDVVNKAINSSVIVFENYEEITTKECTLTEDIKDYFATNAWVILVTITNTNIYNTLNNILSHLSDCISIYITLSTTHKILKTTCVKMDEPLRTVNYLVPINLTDEIEINVNIKIVVNIPGAMDRKKSLTVLYKKDITLTSEHFIKTTQKTTINLLKKPPENIDKIVERFNTIQYGSSFEFTDLSKLESTKNEWNFYIRLPNDYEQIFKTEKHGKSSLTKLKTRSIMLQLSGEEFLKSKNEVIFLIGNEKLKVKVQNDGFSNPLLKVTSVNAKTALSIRNFLANMIYNEYENFEPGKEFINYSFYTTTENIQKSVKNLIKSSAALEDFLSLMDQFEKKIIGALPL